MVPLCPGPKLNAPEVELVSGAATLSPTLGATGPPNMKGDEVELQNTELLVPLLVVWVVARKPEVVATPKAFFMLAGTLTAEAVVFKPKPVCAELPKAGWASADAGADIGVSTGATDGAGAPEFPKGKGLPKLGVRAGLVDLCCCPLAAPNLGWGMTTGYAAMGCLALKPKGILNAGVVVLLKVSVGWQVAARAEVVREPPKPRKPAMLLLLLLVAI